MDMNNEGHLCSILYKCGMAQRGQKQINQKLLGSMPLLTGRRCRGFGDDGKPTKRANIYILVI